MNLFIIIITTLIKASLIISSPDFKHNGYIPSKFTCDGADTSPAIAITDMPTDTKSLVLIVEDPDAPGTFDHWVVWNIPPQEIIKENSIPGIQGKNSAGENKYKGPCPPTGTHRYFFKVYALDTMLGNKAGADKKTIEHAMQGHILAYGEIIGLYQKKSQ